MNDHRNVGFVCRRVEMSLGQRLPRLVRFQSCGKPNERRSGCDVPQAPERHSDRPFASQRRRLHPSIPFDWSFRLRKVAAVSYVSPLFLPNRFEPAMRTISVTALLILCACASQLPREAPLYSYQIVHEYPHDTLAFTEGLFYLDGA